jgi:hypothetical protein
MTGSERLGRRRKQEELTAGECIYTQVMIYRYDLVRPLSLFKILLL